MAQSSSSVSSDPRGVRVDIDIEPLPIDLARSLALDSTGRALRRDTDTVAMPRNRRGPPRIRFSKTSVSEADVLSSADISVLSSAAGRDAPSVEGRAPTVADPLLGVVVADRYRIVERIGRGGMGVVYKVEHVRIGKLLAMKLLTGELSQSPEMVRRFKREALTVSKLHSPNTVQVFDFGASESLTYLVMELVNGENLGRMLDARGPMPFRRLCKIMIQIASSLAEAHKKGIVHRDIKPENVMIVSAFDGTDIAKVLDFGLAKLRGADPQNEITNRGTILGTPFYMSPEQIRGDDVDARADVYAVGALMYRLLTGLHSFSGKPMEVLSKHLKEQPVPPHERAPHLGIPVGVSEIVLKALEKKPRDRFQRIEDLRERLIDELRAGGSASVDDLLDSSRLRLLSSGSEPLASDARRTVLVATRGEVDAYERKLRRKRYGALGVAFGLCASAGIATAILATRPARPPGVESEPNDAPAQATQLDLGRGVKGHLGARIDESHGDRDFYAFELPKVSDGSKSYLSLHVSALPNIPMCTMLYKVGVDDPMGQYCVGRPGRDLAIPALALEPGRYLLLVVQDLGAYGGMPSYVYENVSDTYTVTAEAALPDAGSEVEPNDTLAAATEVSADKPYSATLGWARDEDVFCVANGTEGPVRWKVRTGPRDSGVVEAMTDGEDGEGPATRIHDDGGSKPSQFDAISPWQSARIASSGAGKRCLRVRLAPDPWSAARGAPSGGAEPYTVEAEAVP